MANREHYKEVLKIAGDLPIYFGTGYPIDRPHVVAVEYPNGYFLMKHTIGDNGQSICEGKSLHVVGAV